MISDDRYKQLMIILGMPRSQSLLQALKQVAMESALDERERCAKICEKSSEERFAENGTTETDTGAGYYVGPSADSYEAQDEECESIAAEIRAR